MIRQILEAVSILAIPLIVVMFVAYAAKKKVPVYESFVSGAKGGLKSRLR